MNQKYICLISDKPHHRHHIQTQHSVAQQWRFSHEDPSRSTSWQSQQNHFTHLTNRQSHAKTTTPSSSSSSHHLQPGFRRTGNIACQICGEFMHQKLLREHLSRVHGKKQEFSCHLCGKDYRTYSGLHLHVQTHKGKSFTCNFCGLKFAYKCSLKTHIKKIHNSTEYPTFL